MSSYVCNVLTSPQDAPVASDVQLTDGEIQSNWDEVYDNFDNMGLSPDLLRGVFAYGYVLSDQF